MASNILLKNLIFGQLSKQVTAKLCAAQQAVSFSSSGKY